MERLHLWMTSSRGPTPSVQLQLVDWFWVMKPLPPLAQRSCCRKELRGEGDVDHVPPAFQMRTMSEEAELRMCDEDFGSEEEEGDVESYLEDNSSELMDRLRELEVTLASS